MHRFVLGEPLADGLVEELAHSRCAGRRSPEIGRALGRALRCGRKGRSANGGDGPAFGTDPLGWLLLPTAAAGARRQRTNLRAASARVGRQGAGLSDGLEDFGFPMV